MINHLINRYKFKSNTLKNNHFITKYKVHGIVNRRSRRGVPLCSTTSLVFNVTRYTLIHNWLFTQKPNSDLNDRFYMNMKFDKLLSKIDNVSPIRRL